MDTKSLAKSKRAHTLHHNKKHHPKPTSKPPAVAASVGPANSLKPTGNPIKVKPDRFQGKSALPSNWDRYKEEYDPEVENASEASSASRLTDIVVRKSKGADYGYLISEAKSQALTDYSTPSFPSFDDVLTDSNQGVGSLLSVTGQSILSWIEDDNFVLENKATRHQEAPFLSMDLNALEEQLAKFDISKRLFIEADLLLQEQYTAEVQANQKQKSSNSEVMLNCETATKGSSELFDGVKQTNQIDVTGTTTMTHPVIGEQRKSRIISKGLMPESIAQVNVSSAAVQNSQPSRFEAADAEAELDMLLKSFSESKISKSPVFREDFSCKTDASTSGSIGVSSDGFVPIPVNEGPELSKSALAIDLDDSLDELLKETSSQINQKFASRSHEVKATTLHVMPSPPSVSPPKSKLLDDFDSWLDTI